MTKPKTDPSYCPPTPAAGCDALEGFALAHELFAGNVGLGVVRGYFATVAADAAGWVTPRFARAASAALWNQMIAHWTGRREAAA